MAARWMPGGRGALRLDVSDGRLDLFFNGRRMLSAQPLLPAAGEIGLQIAGTRARAENFAAVPLA